MKRLFAIVLLAVAPIVLGAQQRDGFPHDKHAKLFPVCTSCHGSTTDNGALRSLPAPSQCVTCHDGSKRRRVTWAPPESRPVGLLAFSHSAHDAKAGTEANCQSCHATATTWMAIGKAAPATCVGCHAHKVPEHLSPDAKCTTCHRPLARAVGMTDAQIKALPKPATHESSDFLEAHGAQAKASIATCATCHAQQSCARCHLDASRNATIAALSPDVRVARLAAALAPNRPQPADHKVADFVAGVHGRTATASTARCAVCHTQTTCLTCHTGTIGRTAIASLTPGAPAPTATRVASRPATDWTPAPHSANAVSKPIKVHADNWSKVHGPSAASEATTCSGCHAQRFCKDCHAAERVGAKRYHPANFVSRHAPEAYSAETECATCHSVQAFCRDCHRQAGFAATSQRRGTGFHNGAAPWLLQHGRAARQDLTGCTSCHQQSYCTQCHSNSGWSINPHGPDFDAARMAARNRTMCLRCHLRDPLAPKP